MKQPHEMTDTELNRAMTWLYIEKLPPYVKDCFIEDYGGVLQIDLVEGMWDIDFLSDWNLTMPLAIYNNLNIKAPSFMKRYYSVHQYYVLPNIGTRKRESWNKDLLRAICEVLVAIAMEKAK